MRSPARAGSPSSGGRDTVSVCRRPCGSLSRDSLRSPRARLARRPSKPGCAAPALRSAAPRPQRASASRSSNPAPAGMRGSIVMPAASTRVRSPCARFGAWNESPDRVNSYSLAARRDSARSLHDVAPPPGIRTDRSTGPRASARPGPSAARPASRGTRRTARRRRGASRRASGHGGARASEPPRCAKVPRNAQQKHVARSCDGL